MLTKEQEQEVQNLKAQYENGMLPYENYIEMKRAVMGADYKEDADAPAEAAQSAAAPPPVLPMMETLGAAPAPAAIKYNVRVDNKEIGVFDREVLFKMIEDGDIDKDAMVWQKNFDDWKTAVDVPELEDHFPASPPPGSKADKRRKAKEEAIRKEEERVKAEEQRKIDEKRKAEETKKRKEEEAALAEQQRKLDEVRKAEERRRAEEQRKADIQRRADEAEIKRIENQSRADEAARRRVQSEANRQYAAATAKTVIKTIFAVFFGLVFALTAGSLILSLVTYILTPGLIAMIIVFLVTAGLVFLFIFNLFKNRPIFTIILFTILVVVGVINGGIVQNLYSHIFLRLGELRNIENPIPGLISAPEKTGTVSGVSSLNLRDGPSTNHGIIKSLPEGTTVIITGEPENNFLPVKIKNADGSVSEGYIGSRYIIINE